MQNKFCPKCGAKNTYEYDPPTKCKCGLIFADAFKIKLVEVTESRATVNRTAQLGDDNEYELVRVKKKKISTAKTLEEMELEDFSDDNYNESDIKNEAREIAASLNENDIIINYGVEEPEKLGKFLPKQEQNAGK